MEDQLKLPMEPSSFLKVMGTIFRIERFATFDGPGIRTVVFLKGCPLACIWCSTPESQKRKPELGYDAQKCTQCGECVKACPFQAISVSESKSIITDLSICNHCGECIPVCPTGARMMIGEKMSVNEVFKVVEKDAPFYHHSGGGLTLSGGEPTLQPEFVKALLKKTLNRGIHTAMETCAYARWEVLDEVVNYLDLVYVDIKHMSPEHHRRLTGKDNALILENIQKIAKHHKNTSLIIRVPVIPGCNDAVENIRNTAEFVSRISGIERIELLPYHRFGRHMYPVIFKTYALQGTEIPEDEQLQGLKKVIEEQGVPAQIGG